MTVEPDFRKTRRPRPGWTLGSSVVILTAITIAVIPYHGSSQAELEQLLRIEALAFPPKRPSTTWRRQGTNALPVLCRALELTDSTPRRLFLNACWWLSHELHWPGLQTPSAADYRGAAARAVASMGFEAQSAIPSLIRALTLGTPNQEATTALMGFGPAAAAAAPALFRQATSSPPSFWACRALLRVGGTPTMWELLRQQPQSFVRLTGEMGGDLAEGQTNQALQRLAKAGVDLEDRIYVWELLHDLGPHGAPLVPHLIPNLQDPSDAIRWRVAWLLGGMGPSAAAAVEPLKAALEREPDSVARLGIIRALGQIGPAARAAVGTLEQFLHGDREDQIQAAREALESIQK